MFHQGLPMNTQKGFTLMELMITVVIVAILAAIAIPNYQSHMIRTRRATAATCLLELSQALERSHAINMTYTGFTLPVTQCSTDLSGHYSFSVANLTAQTYTLSAAPRTRRPATIASAEQPSPSTRPGRRVSRVSRMMPALAKKPEHAGGKSAHEPILPTRRL